MGQQREEQLRPLKRAALEQRLHELQRDTSVEGGSKKEEESQGGGGSKQGSSPDTPARAVGVPVPSTEADHAVVLRDSAREEEDPRASARRGTYFGLYTPEQAKQLRTSGRT